WNARAPTMSEKGRRITRRKFLIRAAAIPPTVLLGSALPASARRARLRGSARNQDGVRGACALPTEVLDRVERGWDPERSGQLLSAPHGWNSLDGFISHSTPWGYTQNVPMFWYGPGFVPAKGKRGTYVTSPDVAPTVARFVGFTFDAPDGSPMLEAIEPNAP